MACENIKSEIDVLLADRADYAKDLQKAGPGEKPYLASQIKIINQQVERKRRALNDCLIANGVAVPFSTSFVGTAALTTSDSRASGPFASTVTLGLLFNAARTDITVTNFPPITAGPFSTQAGPNTTTITMSGRGRGTFNKNTGQIVIPMELFADQSLVVPFLELDSVFTVLVGTGSMGNLQGSPLNKNTLALTLIGSGLFAGGFLAGQTGTLVMTGKLAGLP